MSDVGCEMWEFGDLRMWGFGNLGIGNLGIGVLGLRSWNLRFGSLFAYHLKLRSPVIGTAFGRIVAFYWHCFTVAFVRKFVRIYSV